jgi:hypothetical protein
MESSETWIIDLGDRMPIVDDREHAGEIGKPDTVAKEVPGYRAYFGKDRSLMPAKAKAQQGTPRLRLSAAFLESLEKDFQAHRDEVIAALRKESPKAYAELLGRLVQTADPPAEKTFANCNSMRDIGHRLLVSVGVSDPTDEMIDLACAANDVFIASLEKIRDDNAGKLN